MSDTTKEYDPRIQSYMHCGKCIQEAGEVGQSPAEYARLNVGWTGQGIQVWCQRHSVNVAYFDPMGEPIAVDARTYLTDEPTISMMLQEDEIPACSCCTGGHHDA